MKLSNKISFFVLSMVIIAVCDAKSTGRKSKSVEKHHSKHSESVRDGWPFGAEADCKYQNTYDTDYLNVPKDDDFELKSWPDCGLNRVSSDEPDEDSTFEDLFHNLEQLLSQLLGQAIFGESKSARKGPSDRIINGKPVKKGEWPWLVALGNTQFGQYCGGTIIGDRWILTAAHCFLENGIKPCFLNVQIGTTNWKEDPDGTGISRRVVGIYRHPDYDTSEQKTHVNDIALLKLDEPIPLSPDSTMNAICIPETPRSAKPGTTCYAAGWGQTDAHDTSSVSPNSMTFQLPVIGYNEDKCGDYPAEVLLPGMLCAGYVDGTGDACQDDSGGPLTYQKDGKFYLLGATLGVGCAEKTLPGLYTDVGQYRHWIWSVLKRYS